MGVGWHSAMDCQAARSRMHDKGAHSSELAWRFAEEYAAKPCLTRDWVRYFFVVFFVVFSVVFSLAPGSQLGQSIPLAPKAPALHYS